MIRYLFLIFPAVLPGMLSGQATHYKSVTDICRAYPAQISAIFQDLALDHPGFDAVKNAWKDGNLENACQNLLTYYRLSDSREMLARELPESSNRTTPEGDSVLRDIYMFQEVADQVPRNNNGQLNWYYEGPENDIEWAWALNRHYPVQTLLTAWYQTGNKDYLGYIDAFIQDWIISSWPYPGVKSSTAMWRGLEVSFRVKIWARVFFELMDYEEITPATRLLILSSLPDHAHYARQFHAENNWLTMEMSGLATVAAYWPEFLSSPEWLAYTVKTMVESMRGQVYPDGVQTELTSSYHYVALNNFMQFQEICQRAGIALPEYFRQTIDKMWSYLVFTMRPDGYGILNNDADRMNNSDRINNYLNTNSHPEWKYVIEHGETGKAPSSVSWFYPWAGQLISRNHYGPNAHWSFFDIGPWGSGHQHNDKLHLSVAAHGHDFLVDAGRFAYRGAVAEKFRDYARGSAGHNLILFNGHGQSPGPRLSDSPVAEEHFSISAQFDYAWGSMSEFQDSQSGHEHLRTLVYVRDAFWIVVDKVQSDLASKKSVLWHWHPRCDVVIDPAKRTVGSYEDGAKLTIIPVNDIPWEVELIKGQDKPAIQGWYSPEYNIYESNYTSIYQSPQNENDLYVWIILPSFGDSPAIKSKVLEKNESVVTLEVDLPGRGNYKLKIPYRESEKMDFSVTKK